MSPAGFAVLTGAVEALEIPLAILCAWSLFRGLIG